MVEEGFEKMNKEYNEWEDEVYKNYDPRKYDNRHVLDTDYMFPAMTSDGEAFKYRREKLKDYVKFKKFLEERIE